MDEREALSIGPKHSEPRPKPRTAWSGAYRIGPSPQHALRHLPKATTNEDFQIIRSPLPSHIDITQSVPKLSTIPGSPRPRNGKQTTGDQQPRSLENDSIPSHNTVSNTAKNPTSASGSSSPASFQLVHYDPSKKTAAESIHAVRSNAVRYQWKRSKAVRPRGRKTKVPETTDSPSRQAGTSRKDQAVNANKPGQTIIKSRTIPDQNRLLVKLPSPGSDSSLQPGGYPTELPSGSVAPLYHLGMSPPSLRRAENHRHSNLTVSSLRSYQPDLYRQPGKNNECHGDSICPTDTITSSLISRCSLGLCEGHD